jgi:phosphoglucomutase
MAVFNEVQTYLSQMILSHSGWRGVFAACGEEEGRTGEISDSHRIIVAGAAAVFAESLGAGKETAPLKKATPLVLIGSDTRPTGKIIAETMIPVLLACGCQVRYAGVVAAPEIMAWARSLDGQYNAAGFIYISASHNPIGHNGLKFGLTDGGVLPAEEGAKLTETFRRSMADPSCIAHLEQYVADANFTMTGECIAVAKKEAFDAYLKFSAEVAWGGDQTVAEELGSSIARQPLGVCCDFNGSARCVSIDRDFLCGIGMQFEAINAQPGEIAHRIVPEGESLEPCCAFLEKLHDRNPAFVLGYVPDCDGDRGNLVIWDDNLQKARALEAQEVFALACVAELAQLRWGSGKIGIGDSSSQIAVVVNDPTSLRVDRIAAAFGAEVFRAEVGEANVVGLARRLRENGYTVRILGEGSAGGNITHPSAVRDPIHTVLALVKLLSLRTSAAGPGLFELWCNASGQKERCKAGFNLAEIIDSLPPFVTTPAYSPEAILKINSTDHGALKSRYQRIFLRDWDMRKNQLRTDCGIHSWEAIAYNGMEERKGIGDFSEAGRGGLKINFLNANGAAIALLWMRGSATEPVFRIMAEIEGTDRRIERELIDWQRRMTIEADKGA